MNPSKGIALIEVLIGAAIIGTSFVAIIGVYASLTRLSHQALPRIQAAMLAEEGIEAIRAIRDKSYDAGLAPLSNGTAYHLAWSTASSTFFATTVSQDIDQAFTRTFTVANAYRDGSYSLAPSGTNDPDTRLVTVNVSWMQGTATSTYTLQSYVSNIFND